MIEFRGFPQRISEPLGHPMLSYGNSLYSSDRDRCMWLDGLFMADFMPAKKLHRVISRSHLVTDDCWILLQSHGRATYQAGLQVIHRRILDRLHNSLPESLKHSGRGGRNVRQIRSG